MSENQNGASTPEAAMPEPPAQHIQRPLNLLSLPTEVLFMIYKAFFSGVRLVPGFRETGSVRDGLLSPHSRVALLLVCKSQYADIKRALWECATVDLSSERALATFVIGDYPWKEIRVVQTSIGRDGSVHNVLLMSKAIRKLPNLQELTIDDCSSVYRTLKLKYDTLLVAQAGFSSAGTRGWIRDWIGHYTNDFVNPLAFKPFSREGEFFWQRRPTVIVRLKFGSQDDNPENVRIDSKIHGLLELSEVYMKFGSGTWALSGLQKGQRVEFLQQAFTDAEIQDYFRPLSLNATVSQEHQEQNVWAIVSENFSDVDLNPTSVYQLYHTMSLGFRSNVSLMRVGAALLVDGCQYWAYIMDGAWALSDDFCWEYWRRVLKASRADTERAKNREWKRFFHQERLRSSWIPEKAEPEQQRFFARLFDPAESWPPPEREELEADDNPELDEFDDDDDSELDEDED